jgi:predicted O-linked N-acetylglucosamine transferase (SPINDLY family)
MTLQQQFESGLAHHQGGRFAEAEAIYRQILRQNPNHAEALHLLGVLAAQVGRLDAAVELIRRAIRLQPEFAEAHCNLGNALKEMGQLGEAIASFRQAIRLKPNYAEAHGNLGIALKDDGQLRDAIAVYLQAIRLRPDYVEVHNNLGLALRDAGQLDEAIASFRQAIRLKPDLAEAHCNLGNALKDVGQLDEAIASYRLAVRLKPDLAVAHNNLGNALKERGQLDEGITCFRQAIRLKPDFADGHYSLAIALMGRGQLDEAIAAYRHAIRINPDHAEAYGNLGIALEDMGQHDDAIASHRQAIRLRPDLAEAHCNLGNALKGMGQLDEAIASFRQAIRLKPDLAEAHSNLGGALKSGGMLDEAVACYERAIRLKPDDGLMHGDLVFSLHYHPGYDGEMMREELGRWNRQHAEPLKKFIQPHPNDRDRFRRLRIGYVSPDFCAHAVGQNLLPLLREHDHGQMEIFCYANMVRPDGLTEQFRRYADGWRNIVGLSDAQAVDLIRQDWIDILIDLALHTGGNRLGVFARKPAPVEATFAGYPGSTGLETIDYRLTDPYLDPPGLNDRFYSETSIRLPDSFWCYDSLVTELAVNALPAQSQGHVTFGCLNSFCKVNEKVLRLWAQVLKTVDRSRLMILCPEGSHRQPLLDMLQREGIDHDRIELIARRPRVQYLELYHRIDVGLDTFPYNGHTTSLDSFWMGVPVITLVGQTAVGRAGLSQLTNLGLPELIAQTPERYVQIATDLAGDLPRLAELRRTLRKRMEASPLMDAPRFARNIEAAYRQMWRNWCATGGESSLQCPAP